MFYRSQLMAQYGIQAVFSDKHGGVSKGTFASLNIGCNLGDKPEYVEKNMALLCQAAQMPRPHQAAQAHGVEVLYCDGAAQYHQAQADILLASNTATAVGVRTADCLPILLADVQQGIVAAVHAGWRGSVAHVVVVAVHAMLAKGAHVDNMLASFGPHIGECCFEVSLEVGGLLHHASKGKALLLREGKWFADLAKVNMSQLLRQGFSIQQIEVSKTCTVCSSKPAYFSYRRDCGKTGRQIAMIVAP